MAVTYLHVTVAGAGVKDGTTWAKAMGMAEFRDHMQDTVVADTVYFVKPGTYTFAEAHTCKAVGAAATPVKVIGVLDATTNEGAAVVYADYAYTSNRPLIAMEANVFIVGIYWHFYNCQFTTTHANGIDAQLGYATFFNCKGTQSGAGTTNSLFYCATAATHFIKCECISTGYGIRGPQGCAIGCYIHDCAFGVAITYRFFLVNCVVEACTTGVSIASAYGSGVINTTIHGCGTGISGSTGSANVFVNVILSQCTTDGIKWTTVTSSNFFGWNLLNNADACDDYDGVAAGINDVLVDHSTAVLNDTANHDFRLLTTNATRKNIGCMPGANEGLAAANTFYINFGADQTDALADLPSPMMIGV